MLFSTLVIGITAIVLILVGTWCFSPALRRWMEEPKYRMLRQEDRFEARRIESQGPDSLVDLLEPSFRQLIEPRPPGKAIRRRGDARQRPQRVLRRK
jgi:hypothetical protein